MNMRHSTIPLILGCLLAIVLPSAFAQQVPLSDVADSRCHPVEKLTFAR